MAALADVEIREFQIDHLSKIAGYKISFQAFMVQILSWPRATASTRRHPRQWKRRSTAADLPARPKDPRSTVFSIEDEAIIVAFRSHELGTLAR
jgi:hypothetical protein